MAKFLTKSRYKIGRECPTKLYYHNNRKEYADKSLDDPFLLALARGGFQVGELAKIYNPAGTDIKTLDHEESIKLTQQEISKEKCTIYEPAFLFENLFIRVDVFRKSGRNIDLVEVKAKSIDPAEENPFWNKRELKKGLYKLSESWKPYLYDIAFQTYVMQKVHPEWSIRLKLMLANKAAIASVDGLNQMFKIIENEGRTEAYAVEGVDINTVGDRILVEIDVTEQVEMILENKIVNEPEDQPFLEEVQFLSEILIENRKESPTLGSECKSCQFKCNPDTNVLKSGFHECWSGVKRKPDEIDGPFVFDIWNFRKSDKLIKSGIYLAKELDEDDINPTHKDGSIGLSSSERQWGGFAVSVGS